jgi:D-amino-acid dehydrogenase
MVAAPRSSPGHVVVIGAGIVGLASAWCLHRDGWRVTVIERERPGAGASGGNGAQLSYAYVQPLADPAIWKQLPELLFLADSPLRWQPLADPHQWAWCLRFLAACRAGVSQRSTAQLLALAAESRRAFDTMLAHTGIDADFSGNGKLVLYASPASFDAARRQLALQARLGGPAQTSLTPAQCVDVEPALADYAAHIAGGIHTPSECTADCLRVCEGLHRWLEAVGVRFELGTQATAWVSEGRRLAAVRTNTGEVAADAFVLAAGVASVRLGRALGLRLPLYPLKGYSITLPLDEAVPAGAAPRVSVTDASRKVVFARIGKRLRVAGMVELVGEDTHLDPARIAALQAATRAVFPRLATPTTPSPWCGLRPATPTGLPLIGRCAGAPDNLLLNTGHGGLGFTLAMGSAERVARALRQPG